MLIVCPNCATSYQVETSSLGPTGRSVRCVRCRNVWFARDPAALPAIAEAHRSDMQTLAASIAAVARGEVEPGMAGLDGPLEGAFISAHAIDGDPATAAAATPTAFADPDGEMPSLPGEADPWSSEPIAIADAPGLAPMEQGSALPADPTLDQDLGRQIGQAPGRTPGEDIETAARRSRRAKSRSLWMLPGLPVAILALVALNAALIHWRANVVRIAPQTASLYAAIGLPVNLRGLTFNDVTTTIESHDGVQVLVVEGRIASASQRPVEVPRLRFSVRNRSGQEVYAWTALPSRNGLAPGETLTFRSRLASPPPDAREVLVRFFNRRDLVAGVQ
jgi:predicted Zn finger-like uncharacterized protein